MATLIREEEKYLWLLVVLLVVFGGLGLVVVAPGGAWLGSWVVVLGVVFGWLVGDNLCHLSGVAPLSQTPRAEHTTQEPRHAPPRHPPRLLAVDDSLCRLSDQDAL